ncbi:MAG: CynX/NimT family MFS transporter [Sphingomonadaceae bacterium]
MPPRWRALAVLTFARLGLGFQFQSVAALSPFLSEKLGFDAAQIGLLIGIYLLPGALVALPGGLLGARFGDKRVSLAALGLMTVGGLGVALAGDFATAFAARAASGAGAVVFNVMVTKMVADWFAGREIVLAMSILMNAWPIGIGVALYTLASLAEVSSWQLAMAASALLALAGLAAVQLGYRPAAGAQARAAGGLGLALLSRGELWRVALSALPWTLYNGAYALLVAFLPQHLHATGMGVTAAASAVATVNFMFIATVIGGGYLVQRLGHADAVSMLCLAAWAGTLALMLGAPGGVFWLFAGGVIGGVPAGALVALPAEVLRPQNRAPGMGVFYTVFYLGGAFAPALGGYLLRDTKASASPIWLAVALALATIVSLIVFRRAALSSRG